MQEIRNSGAVGYKYITVDEDDAANVIFANGALLHLGSEQIPRGAAVSISLV
jgi:dimethylargininase